MKRATDSSRSLPLFLMYRDICDDYEKNLMVPCIGSSLEGATGFSATISPVACELMLSRISRVRL